MYFVIIPPSLFTSIQTRPVPELTIHPARTHWQPATVYHFEGPPARQPPYLIPPAFAFAPAQYPK